MDVLRYISPPLVFTTFVIPWKITLTIFSIIHAKRGSNGKLKIQTGGGEVHVTRICSGSCLLFFYESCRHALNWRVCREKRETCSKNWRVSQDSPEFGFTLFCNARHLYQHPATGLRNGGLLGPSTFQLEVLVQDPASLPWRRYFDRSSGVRGVVVLPTLSRRPILVQENETTSKQNTYTPCMHMYAIDCHRTANQLGWFGESMGRHIFQSHGVYGKQMTFLGLTDVQSFGCGGDGDTTYVPTSFNLQPACCVAGARL